MDADEARPAGDQNSAHDQIPLAARAGKLVPRGPCSRPHLVTMCLRTSRMDFETGMENLTTACDGNCDCSPDPALLADFKRAIHTLGGKWKLEILFALMNGAVRFGVLRRY